MEGSREAGQRYFQTPAKTLADSKSVAVAIELEPIDDTNFSFLKIGCRWLSISRWKSLWKSVYGTLEQICFKNTPKREIISAPRCNDQQFFSDDAG